MTRRFFSGNTLEQAIMLAARHYGVAPEELEYRQVEKRHGFLRTRKAVVIAVDPERPRRVPGDKAADEAGEEPGAGAVATAPPPRPEPAPPLEPAGPEPAAAEPALRRPDTPPRPEPAAGREGEEQGVAAGEAERAAETEVGAELLEAARGATEILLRFAGIDAEAAARAGHERVEVEIQGPDEEVLVVEEGKGLLAIQHLLPRMLRGLTGRSSFVRVDSGGFHAERKARLETLARREAGVVRQQRRSRTLAPMAPDERRIVHLALNDDPSVITESRGYGLHKRIVIRPAEGEDGDGSERPPRPS